MHEDCTINAPLPSHLTQQVPRARGAVHIGTKMRDGASVIGDLRQAGSSKLVFPRARGTALDGVIVNTAGGITGGDKFSVEAEVRAGTSLCLTTQAAERAYRAQPGEVGQLTSHVTVQKGATLHWLPQELILFQGAQLRRRLRIDLATDARVLMCEPLVFGRTAMGETVTQASLDDRIDITQEGRPLFTDALHLRGDIAAHLARPTVASGAVAIACLLYVAPDAETHLAPLRATLGPTAGVSLLRPDTLVLRALGRDSFALRKTLIPVLTRLSGGPLPRPWMI